MIEINMSDCWVKINEELLFVSITDRSFCRLAFNSVPNGQTACVIKKGGLTLFHRIMDCYQKEKEEIDKIVTFYALSLLKNIDFFKFFTCLIRKCFRMRSGPRYLRKRSSDATTSTNVDNEYPKYPESRFLAKKENLNVTGLREKKLMALIIWLSVLFLLALILLIVIT